MVNPATGLVIASLCVVVKRGGKNPCVVEFASITAEVLEAEEAPAIIFPPAVIAPLVFTSVTAVFPN